MNKIEHVLWLHRHADFVTAREQQLHAWAEQLRDANIASSLCYQIDGRLSAGYLQPFVGVYPCVAPDIQQQAIAADLLCLVDVPNADQCRALYAIEQPCLLFCDQAMLARLSSQSLDFVDAYVAISLNDADLARLRMFSGQKQLYTLMAEQSMSVFLHEIYTAVGVDT